MNENSDRLPRIDIFPTAGNTTDDDAKREERLKEMLRKGELPTRFAPGVSRWMTWTFAALVVSLPLIQTFLEIGQGAVPHAVELFWKRPSRKNLQAFEKTLEQTSFAKRLVQRRLGVLFDASGETTQPFYETAGNASTSNAAERKTPFIEWVGDGKGLVLHPLIGYTRGQGIADSELDYFGFRNKNKRIYFERPQGKLVVISGHSEILGATHVRPIAERLEEYLNAHGNEKWSVLNLGMNCYTLPYELNAYVFLAHHLKPDHVISHSFVLDAYNGLMMPREFQALGLFYYKALESWYMQARGIAPTGMIGLGVGSLEGKEVVVDSYLRTARKFRDIVSANHGHFTLGIIGYRGLNSSEPLPPGAEGETLALLPDLYVDLRKKLPHQNLDYIDFSAMKSIIFRDEWHTCEKCAQVIAEVYADHILRIERLSKSSPEHVTIINQREK